MGKVREFGVCVAGGLNGYGVTVTPLIVKAVGNLVLNNAEGLDKIDVNVLECCNPGREVSMMCENRPSF